MAFILCGAANTLASGANAIKPNFVLVMTDDQGWGEMGYYGHPVLLTPNLDKMAANGLQFDRFYAGAPKCSPTRASVMTGRSNDRTGVFDVAYPLRLQEKTLPQALRKAGYATGHFGKWHLNGFAGPGVPVLETDPRGPGPFGFDEWLSVTNYFDRNPLMSNKGQFVDFKGDSSEIIVAEALKFVELQVESEKPFLAVIWFGSPHRPFISSDEDKANFTELEKKSQNHYGELVAMDRSIGTLRNGLRELNIAENTLVWFNSDNGGLDDIRPDTAGDLRGYKGSIFEGGIRVPAIVEWPAVIKKHRLTKYPAVTMDIFPTLAAIAGVPETEMLEPADGLNIRPLFDNEIGSRSKPIPFRHKGRAAFIDNDYKLLSQNLEDGVFELFNLVQDPTEQNNLFSTQPEMGQRLVAQFMAWNREVEASVNGEDYLDQYDPEDEPKPRRKWISSPEYKTYIEEFKKRPEYEQWIPEQRKSSRLLEFLKDLLR